MSKRIKKEPGLEANKPCKGKDKGLEPTNTITIGKARIR